MIMEGDTDRTKEIEERRNRSNKISSLIGEYLLKGYTMLNEICSTCGTVLMKDRQQKYHCVACDIIDREETVQENVQTVTSLDTKKTDIMEFHAPKPKEQKSRDIQTEECIHYARMALKRKLAYSADLLLDTSDVDLSTKITKLIQTIHETLKAMESG